MKRIFSAAAVLFALSLGPAKAAEDHVILIMSDGYFPQTTYLSPGDTVEFVNASTTNQTIVAENNGWSLGPIAPNAAERMVIEEGVQMNFFNADVTDETGTFTIEGSVSFSSAPLN